jgi:D-threonine aldolase
MNDWWQISNAHDIPTPTLLIYPDRIDSNLDKMIAWTRDASRLRPHVKTHKLPEVIAMKRAKGIDKFKTSTIAESEMVAMAGGRDVLLAMQPVGYNFHRLLQLMAKYPATQFSTLVDDASHMRWMQREAEKESRTIRLFVDLNVGMDRTGVAIGDAALELYRQLCKLSSEPKSSISVGGLHAYDGHLHMPDISALVSKTFQAFDKVWEFRGELLRQGLEVPTVVASGTPTSPILASLSDPTVEVSAGTTVLWDFGQQETCPLMTFQHAAVLLMRVVSRPTSNRLCIDLGHKAVASEFPHPRVQILGLEDAQFVMHSEEHLVVETSRSQDFPVGTVLYGVPRHICPTVALHSHVWCVRDQRAVEAWHVTARDRILTI